MGNMVRLELEKTNVFEVLDKYDVEDQVEKQGIDVSDCYGKSCLIAAGKSLGADKMLSGSVDRFGEKIIIILRLVDVQNESIEKTSVVEYINEQPEIQKMVMISIADLLNLEVNEILKEQLVNVERPVVSSKTKVKLNGPRMGVTFTGGNTGERLMANKSEGGYNMYPVTSMFGYQYEVQYLSAGDFQALLEMLATVNGLESGSFVPSVTLMNGFRFNKNGWEFGFGPTFRAVKTAEGYYDEGNQWVLKRDMPEGADYSTKEAIDYRGDLKLNTSLLIAAGKTFRSGYLNIPVNVYFSPRKEGSIVGVSFGFNVAKKPKM
ncbi:MAG: hypothetical protein C0594_04140 [Marinilabiliales bacterium]|nr:MAG: hypothetical protein C0594_04140 [Marinilabiliales bacterium]